MWAKTLVKYGAVQYGKCSRVKYGTVNVNTT